MNPPDSPSSPFLPRLLAAGITGVILFCVIMAGFVWAYQASYRGRIFPGVSVAGVDLSGRTPDEAAVALARRLDYPSRGRIAFQDGAAVWVATPSELGLRLDAGSSAQAAYQVGRGISTPNPLTALGRLSNPLEVWFTGQDLPPLLVYDERVARQFVDNLGALIDKPTLEASLALDGLKVVVVPGQIGRTLDVDANLAMIASQLKTLTDGLIPLVIEETPPLILDATVQAEAARQILSAPLTLRNPDAKEGETSTWVLDPATLAGMLIIERTANETGGQQFQIALDPAQLQAYLENIAPSLAVDPVDARFIFDDDTRQLDLLTPSVIGRRLLPAETAAAIDAQLAAGVHTVDLLFAYTPPAATSEATAESLGITGLVSAQTSYFYGSSTPRIQNIATASSRFHGLLVAPHATFSMAEVLGDISLDSGYAEALIIFGDRTIKGVGGGVCQVSTTLFRTVFFGGYQIDERYSHAYRVYYYELAASGSVNTNLAGLDATVFVPLVDFKFTNDSDSWLLMETYVDAAARSLTWKFYSTSDGRTVEWATSGLRNRVEPPKPLYQENSALAKGEVRQVDWEVEGADVSVTRTVTRDGVVIHEDVFNTHYEPWRAIYEYGPGTKNMPPKDDD